MTSTDPGWYRDPSDARRHRYWDGEQWHSQSQQLHREGSGNPCPDEDDQARG